MAKKASTAPASTAPVYALTAEGQAIAARDGQSTAHRNLEPEYDHGRWRHAEGGRVGFSNSRAAVLSTLDQLGETFTRADGVAALVALQATHPLALGHGRKPNDRFSWAIRKGFIAEVEAA